MKRSKITSLAALVALLFGAGCSDPADKVHKTPVSEPQKSASGPSQSGEEYLIRAESTIGFVGSKVTGSHNGGFKNFAGKINVAGGKIVRTPEIKIDMLSTWSDNNRLTGHLKSADFFDVEKFPVTTFTVTSIEAAAALQMVTGNLNLHGVTKSISFPANIQIADDAVTVKAEFAINRKDFNVNFPGRPNDLIRDHVVIKLDIKATPARGAEASAGPESKPTPARQRPGAAQPEDQFVKTKSTSFGGKIGGGL